MLPTKLTRVLIFIIHFIHMVVKLLTTVKLMHSLFYYIYLGLIRRTYILLKNANCLLCSTCYVLLRSLLHYTLLFFASSILLEGYPLFCKKTPITETIYILFTHDFIKNVNKKILLLNSKN